jgi:hypothetical protein
MINAKMKRTIPIIKNIIPPKINQSKLPKPKIKSSAPKIARNTPTKLFINPMLLPHSIL